MRLIDAERLRAEIFKASMDEHFMPMKLLDCDTVTEIIDNAPTIEERKTGKWISEIAEREDWKGIKRKYFQPNSCSVCHKPSNIGEDYPYCPNCGAKMEGAEEYAEKL